MLQSGLQTDIQGRQLSAWLQSALSWEEPSREQLSLGATSFEPPSVAQPVSSLALYPSSVPFLTTRVGLEITPGSSVSPEWQGKQGAAARGCFRRPSYLVDLPKDTALESS
jgi:hypothetical protein